MALGKDILVLSEESRRCFADMQTGKGVDLSRSVRSGIV